jgi:hypothetical protein
VTVGWRSTHARSTMSAKPTTEHMMSGQMGQPAACMMLIKWWSNAETYAV